MFEKYGEFNSAEELNVAAATALEQGDKEAVKALAIENGIDEEDAQDYIDGYTPELCSPLMAAVGKLNVEKKALDLPSFMEGWLYMLNDMMSQDEKAAELVAGIRKKGKTLVGLMGKLMKLSSENRKQVPDAIVKAAGMSGKVYVGDIDHITFMDTVKEYYLK